jgi:asparagine synthase (glutamine-hydrolysing)
MVNIEAILRHELKGAVKRNKADGILLSGGLDSSILAFLSPGIKAFTVFLKPWGDDRKFVSSVVQHLGLEHCQGEISVDEAIEGVPEVIKILRTFDPAIPNDLAIYFGMKLAREKGIKSVMTGDAGDELFAGYSFMFKLDLNEYIPRIAGTMHFSSQDIGSAAGLEIKQPFIDKKFIKFALSVEPGLKVMKKGWRTFGKWILRKAFEKNLPGEIIWQGKRPIEKGSGFTLLREIIESKISDSKFEKRSRDYPIKFISKEHLYYYEIYKKVVGDIPKPLKGEVGCPGCGAGILKGAMHCRICGWALKDR